MNSNAMMRYTLYGANGAAERVDQLTKLQVADRYGLSTRDLRVFDLPTSGFSHILVRENTILLHMFDLRLLVQADRLLVFHVEERISHGHAHGSGHVEGRSTTSASSSSAEQAIAEAGVDDDLDDDGDTVRTSSTAPTILDTGDEDRNVSHVFAHDLVRKIDGSHHRDDKANHDNGRNIPEEEQQQQKRHKQPPYELRVIEAALSAVISVLEADFLLTRQKATKELALAPNVNSNNGNKNSRLDSYESLIDTELSKTLALTRKLAGIEQRARQVRDAVGDVLNEDEDMANMYLSDKRESRPHAPQDHQDVEYLLEAYFKASDAVVQEVAALVDNIRRSEASIQSTLRVRRNQIMVLEAKIEVLMLSISVATLIAGYWGMNVVNYLEAWPPAFPVLISSSILVVAFLSFFGMRKLKFIYRMRL